jgi:hypothetical protein
MNNTLIYREGESRPYTKDEITDLILMEALGKEEEPYKAFIDEFEDADFMYSDKSEQIKILKAKFSALKEAFKNYASWKDGTQIKKDIISNVMPLHPDENGRFVILERLWPNEIQRAINLSLAIKKKVYLEDSIKELSTDTSPKSAKITWNRTAYEFGVMILKLYEKEYIDLPAGRGSEGSYEQLAKILFNTFKVEATWPTFKDALNPERNHLSDVKKAKLENFPEDFADAKDLGFIKKRKVK